MLRSRSWKILSLTSDRMTGAKLVIHHHKCCHWCLARIRLLIEAPEAAPKGKAMLVRSTHCHHSSSLIIWRLKRLIRIHSFSLLRLYQVTITLTFKSNFHRLHNLAANVLLLLGRVNARVDVTEASYWSCGRCRWRITAVAVRIILMIVAVGMDIVSGCARPNGSHATQRQFSLIF